MSEKVKAYKAMDENMECRGFQYELDKSYVFNGKVELCASGFHACRKPNDVFEYYDFVETTRVFEVELSGKIIDGENKSVSSEIRIIAEYNWKEILDLVNTGRGNTGRGNSGDRNSGDRNSGDRNSGDRNSGDSNSGYGNSGDRNSGYSNSGDSNSGYSNSGDRNSGYGNSGDRNSGYGNSCNRTSGIFCTRTPQLFLFNKPTDKTWNEIEHPFLGCYQLTEWISEYSMSDVDKLNYPKWETLGGYLKVYSYTDMWLNGWSKDSDRNKILFFKLPNFDLEIFKEITGIDASEDFERLMK